MGTKSVKGRGLAHTVLHIAHQLGGNLSAILTAIECVYVAGLVLFVRAARAVGMEKTAQNTAFQSRNVISVTPREREFV